MSKPNQYDIGQGIRLTGSFSSSGSPADPTTITLMTKDPAGVESTYTYALAQLTKDSVGVYHKDIAPTVSGYWQYRWEGTGTVVAAVDNYFEILPSVFYGGG